MIERNWDYLLDNLDHNNIKHNLREDGLDLAIDKFIAESKEAIDKAMEEK
jgi:hypothetical protein